jgi:hypothetical protein
MADDWDPRSPEVATDQVRAYDAVRERCPVAHSQRLGWSLLRHADALAAVGDPETFSSRVSTHVAVPNGMDGAEHAAYRAVVDRCFTPERVAAFEPVGLGIAEDLTSTMAATTRPIEVMATLGEPYAARSLCAYLDWPTSVADALRRWAADSEEATRTRDQTRLAQVAAEFDALIVAELDAARSAGPDRTSLTRALLDEPVQGRRLTDAELVSILRNWTAGELGTISAAVGIVVEFLARRPDIQALLRSQPGLRQIAMDEMLRLEPPLIANRRRTVRDVELSGRLIPADAPVSILWPAVQRDPRTFPEPTTFRLDRDPGDNLLYGRGPHYCPGEGLSRLQLGVLLDVLLRLLPPFRPAGAPVRAQYPAGGFTQVHIDWAEVPVAAAGDRMPW